MTTLLSLADAVERAEGGQGFSRLASHSVIASRIASARFPGPTIASMRAITSADKRTCVALFPSGGLPIRAGLSGIFFSAKPCMFAVSPIDYLNGIA